MDIETLYQHLVNALFPALRSPTAELRSLLMSCGCQLDDHLLLFTLPQLYQGLCLSLQFQDDNGYKSFKKRLYQGQTNEKLATIGLRVELHQGADQHDQCLYRLVQTNERHRANQTLADLKP
jgi:hypothetical protein